MSKKTANLMIVIGLLMILLPIAFASDTLTISNVFFSNGFENGFTGWTTTYGSPSIISSPVYAGSSAMKATDGSQAYQWITQPLSSTYADAKFRFESFVGNEGFIALFDQADAPLAAIYLDKRGTDFYLAINLYLPTYQYAEAQINIQDNTWFTLGLEVNQNNCVGYYNDAATVNIASANIPTANAASIGMFWGDGQQNYVFVDNVQIGSTSGSSPTPQPTTQPTPTTSPTPIPTPVPSQPPNTYKLVVDVSGQGTVTPSVGTHYYPIGESVIISATPADGWQFVTWVYNDGNTNDNPTVTLTPTTSGLSVTAEFTQINPSHPDPTPNPPNLTGDNWLIIQVLGALLAIIGVVQRKHAK